MNESRIQKILNANPDMFMVIDGDGSLVDYKPFINFEPIMPPEEFLGRSMRDVLPEKIARQYMDKVREVLKTGTVCSLEYTLPVDKVPQYYEARFTPFDDKHVLAVIRDMTERAKGEQELIESKARHSFLFNENPVPMYIYDTQTLNILDANISLVESYGFTRDELITMDIRDIRPAVDIPLLMENVTDLRSGQVYLGYWRHTRKNGTIVDVEITSVDYPFENKPARLVLCVDVTEKAAMQRALEGREKEYRYLFEHNPLPMMIIDPVNMDVINVNNAAVLHYGFAKEEFLNMSARDFRPPGDIQSAERTIQASRQPIEKVGVHRHMKKDGTVILVDIISHEVNYEGHNARLVLCNDVTDQIHAREALEESEAKFRNIVESSPMGLHMYRLDEQGRLILAGANPAADKILNLDHSQLIGKGIEEAFPGLENTVVPNKYREVCLSGQPWHNEQLDYRDNKIDGAFEIHAFQTGQRSISILFLDITEKKRAEETLAESEEKFRKAFFTSPDPMTISRLEDGVFMNINDGFIETTGYTREECLGKSSYDIGLWADDDRREELVSKLQQNGMLENFEARIRTKKGVVRTALISASIINIAQVPRLFTISRDITELKETEKALLASQDQLRASLGEKEILLKEIHHRVKNNLQVISGLLNLQSHYIEDENVKNVYKESQNRIKTMALIHEELYQREDLGRINLADYIKGLTNNLLASYAMTGKRVELLLDLSNLDISIDTAIPCGLIVNELLSNALKHAFPGKKRGEVKVSLNPVAGSKYELVVRDNGIGLPGDLDIKETGSLGLSLVSILAEQLGGDLKIKNEKGAVFSLIFSEYLETGTEVH